MSGVDTRETLEHLMHASGGYADRPHLLRTIGRRGIDRALREGYLERRSRNVYALASAADCDTRAAAEVGGILIGVSAAQYLGWEVLRRPGSTTVAVRHRCAVTAPKRVAVSRRVIREEDIVDGLATAPLRTVLDCARLLPLEEALAIADSAVRRGDVDLDDLLARAQQATGPGRRSGLRIAALADGGAANPFESALRVRCIEAELDVTTQVPIDAGGVTYRVDLADAAQRLVIEGDSFTHHASPEAFAQDCIRYTELTLAGWRVLRMPYPAVVGDPGWCGDVLRRAAAGRYSRSVH